MVDIVLHNLSGLYMGPVAQIAAMLNLPVNDNFRTSLVMENALKVMNDILDDDDTEFPNITLSTSKIAGMMEEQASWAESADSAGDNQMTPADFLKTPEIALNKVKKPTLSVVSSYISSSEK